jgi:hypothetical protein
LKTEIRRKRVSLKQLRTKFACGIKDLFVFTERSPFGVRMIALARTSAYLLSAESGALNGGVRVKGASVIRFGGTFCCCS